MRILQCELRRPGCGTARVPGRQVTRPPSRARNASSGRARAATGTPRSEGVSPEPHVHEATPLHPGRQHGADPVVTLERIGSVSASGRTERRDAIRLGSLGEAVIVGDHRPELFAEVESGREMDGIERSKAAGIHPARAVEDRRGGSEKRHRLQHPTGLDHSIGCDAANGSEQFRAYEIGGDRRRLFSGDPAA